MNQEKILFYISITGIALLNIVQAALRVIYRYPNPLGLICLGTAIGFCTVTATTAYLLNK